MNECANVSAPAYCLCKMLFTRLKEGDNVKCVTDTIFGRIKIKLDYLTKGSTYKVLSCMPERCGSGLVKIMCPDGKERNLCAIRFRRK